MQNVTAIVDKDQSVCFIMPLNRTLVKPPRNFWDMMLKLKVRIAADNIDDSDSVSDSVECCNEKWIISVENRQPAGSTTDCQLYSCS